MILYMAGTNKALHYANVQYTIIYYNAVQYSTGKGEHIVPDNWTGKKVADDWHITTIL